MTYEFRIEMLYDGELRQAIRYTNAIDAVTEWDKCVDYGFANDYATYNFYEPNGKCHTKNFYRSGMVSIR
jgi:hypothetical protein